MLKVATEKRMKQTMRKEDFTVLNAICEAVGIISTLLYIGLQIYCGILYGAGIFTIFTNVAMVLLVYVGLTLLAFYPERVNGLDVSVCTGKIRSYTIHMVLFIKLIFVFSLVFTSICDVMGADVDGAYSLLVVGLMVAIAAFYEIKIFKILRNMRDE